MAQDQVPSIASQSKVPPGNPTSPGQKGTTEHEQDMQPIASPKRAERDKNKKTVVVESVHRVGNNVEVKGTVNGYRCETSVPFSSLEDMKNDEGQKMSDADKRKHVAQLLAAQLPPNVEEMDLAGREQV